MPEPNNPLVLVNGAEVTRHGDALNQRLQEVVCSLNGAWLNGAYYTPKDLSKAIRESRYQIEQLRSRLDNLELLLKDFDHAHS